MKKIKIGIFGVGRGMDLAKDFMLLGADIAAICDFNEERLEEATKKVGKDTAVYSDFDSFIEHDLDAVVLANYFHEHTPFAIKCFEKGIHVFSECISNGTMAEGIELLKAIEKSNSIYMLAENYPQMIFNREMKRVCDGGTLGKILYAEGEYNHPGDPNDVKFKKTYNYFPEHWRNFLPRSYYITHSLGPVMWATGATPKKVTSFASFAPIEGDAPTASFSGDRVSIVTTQNDDGSIFRITGCAAFGGHHNAYRICGTEGQIENLRGMGNKVMLRYNGWSKPEGMDEVNLYEPKWNDPDEEIFKTSGHGGGDYLTARVFLDCIKKGKQPEHPFDIYSAINMSSVAILAHRSMLEGGKPYDIPDFTKEEDCKLYENDRLSPFYGVDGSDPVIPCCSHTDFKPTEKQIENYKKALGLK
ncbi:MAG: Gfo/Idh/MocA family oxidoreductase [Acutalibacteraceae bacterium]|nr:Gfo/Idh/MocA family oxidoreductase [Acutalibacteraceae bacterium]